MHLASNVSNAFKGSQPETVIKIPMAVGKIRHDYHILGIRRPNAANFKGCVLHSLDLHRPCNMDAVDPERFLVYRYDHMY